MIEPLIVLVIKKHQPLNFNITINNPRFKIEEKVAAWLNQQGYKFKKSDQGQASDDTGLIHISSFKVTKCEKTPNIDEVITFLTKEAPQTFVIDMAYVKQIPFMVLPSGRSIAFVK